MIVLFSLVLAVGMLVDNAIVIVENIYRLHCDGQSKTDAAVNGAGEVAWPVINSTLTTLAAFLPLCFWPGIMGQFMSYLPKTVIVVLSASLFVAMVINPAICSVLIGRRHGAEPGEAGTKWGGVMEGYRRLLRGALKQRGLCMALGFAFMFFTLAAFARFGKGVELFPDTEPRRASVEVRYPEGTDIATTDATLRKIEAGLGRYEDIKFYLSNAGVSGQWVMSAGAGDHMGSIQIEFVEFAKRKENTLALVDRIRAEIGRFPGAVIKVDREKEGPPTGAPVSVEVSGEEFDVLQETADRVMDEIKTVPGLVDVDQDMEDARPELQFRVDRQRAAMLKLDTAAVGNYLRTAVNGLEVSKFRAGEDEYDITVRLRENQRQSVDLLKQISITTADGDRVPLASLGSFIYEGGRGQILRKDQKRVITITGNNQGRGSDKVLADVKARVSAMQLPKGYEVSYTGENKDMNESVAFLRKAFLIALTLIALILVLEFNSISQPFMILVSVLLSMVGVMWALLVCNMRFGVIMTGIGVISLAGVVVNNGIVLIDYINRRRSEGMEADEAIVTAAALRLRPVLLTAITTVVGLVPMAVGWSVDFHRFPPHVAASAETSSWWAPMAVAVIFGLLLATVLTLVQVPVMYSLTASATAKLRKPRKPE
jgi:multidrug efflux pump subunit AcrB